MLFIHKSERVKITKLLMDSCLYNYKTKLSEFCCIFRNIIVDHSYKTLSYKEQIYKRMYAFVLKLQINPYVFSHLEMSTNRYGDS